MPRGEPHAAVAIGVGDRAACPAGRPRWGRGRAPRSGRCGRSRWRSPPRRAGGRGHAGDPPRRRRRSRWRTRGSWRRPGAPCPPGRAAPRPRSARGTGRGRRRRTARERSRSSGCGLGTCPGRRGPSWASSLRPPTRAAPHHADRPSRPTVRPCWSAVLSESWATLWEAIADALPDHPAVVVGDLRITWRQLDDRAARLATALEVLGVGPDAKVGQLLYNCPEYLETVYAALKLRAPTTSTTATWPTRSPTSSTTPTPRCSSSTARWPTVWTRSGPGCPACAVIQVDDGSPHLDGAHRYEEPVAATSRRPASSGRGRPPAALHGRHDRPPQGRGLGPRGPLGRARLHGVRLDGLGGARGTRRGGPVASSSAPRDAAPSISAPRRSCTGPRSSWPSPRSSWAGRSCSSPAATTTPTSSCARRARARDADVDRRRRVRPAGGRRAGGGRGGRASHDLSSLQRVVSTAPR